MPDPMSAAAGLPNRRAHRPDPIERGGLAVVITAAVVLSFSALAGLGRMVGFGELALAGWNFPLSLLVPLCIDAYGATAGRIATNRAYSETTRRHAMIHSVIAIGAGIAGNAAYHLIEGQVLDLGGARWVLVVVVSIVPPVALGALVHLMSECARDRQAAEQVHAPLPVPAAVPAEVREVHDVPGQVRTQVHVPGGGPAGGQYHAVGLPESEPGPCPGLPDQPPPVSEPDPEPSSEQVRLSELPPDLAPLALRAVETWAPDGRLAKVPPLRDIKAGLSIGQPKATRVRAYLSELVAS